MGISSPGSFGEALQVINKMDRISHITPGSGRVSVGEFNGFRTMSIVIENYGLYPASSSSEDHSSSTATVLHSKFDVVFGLGPCVWTKVAKYRNMVIKKLLLAGFSRKVRPLPASLRRCCNSPGFVLIRNRRSEVLSETENNVSFSMISME